MSASPEKGPASDPEVPVPKAVVSRLSLYLRELQHLVRDGHETTSSSQLGTLLGFSDAQVRKDLAYFGHFGHPGIGYRAAELITAIRRILGTDRDWPVVIVGTGNLGRALLGYKGFHNQGFRIVAAFDVDAGKIGTSIDGGAILDQHRAIQRAVRLRQSGAAQRAMRRHLEYMRELVRSFDESTTSAPRREP